MRKIPWHLGIAIAAGVPALVLVSIGPVAALAGPTSVLAWALSATIGILMAVLFAEMAAFIPEQTGGIAVLAAHAFAPHSPFLARLAQWSYWLGWSPALAINSALIGDYLKTMLWPSGPAPLAWGLAVLVLGLIVSLNALGIRTGARVQALLAVGTLVPLVALTLVPWLTHKGDLRHFMPFVPPGGWLSWPGLSAFGGALFIAGWSAYGAEITLTYATEYKRASRDAVRVLLNTGLLSVVAYTVIPFSLVAALGVTSIQSDPSTALIPLAQQVTGNAAPLVLVLLLATLLLSVNMVAIGSSRTIYQMARNGHTWPALGQLNRYGVPHRAICFDFAANLILLTVAFAINGGRAADAPIALLATANVGYFLSIILALVAVWVLRRDYPGATRPFKAPRPFLMLGGVFAALNTVLLIAAGAAWGWANIGLGVLVLSLSMLLFTRTTPRARVIARETRVIAEEATASVRLVSRVN